MDYMFNSSVNTKRDATSYESLRSCKREIHDLDALYEAYIRAKQGSDWKPQVQQFEMNFLSGLVDISDEIRDMSYEFKPFSEFLLNERGKPRVIRGEQIEDRIVKHSLCDEVLNPCMYPYLIFDNGASQVGKGIGFTRRRLEYHLHQFYRQHNSNKGYVLLIDFSKYYDNIRHEILLEVVRKYVDDPYAIWLVEKTLERARVDVSYMDEGEYADCLNLLFNSLEYQHIPKEKLTGELFMNKHLNIGDQVAQTAGVSYRTSIDNYVKIVKGVKQYDVYMDDSAAIHESKTFLEDLAADIDMKASEIGITMNKKKTRIVPLSDKWRFLQVQYSLTDSGRLIRKIHPKRLVAMRRRMKSRAPYMYMKDFEDWYQSWFKAHYKLMSKQQRTNMDTLLNQLKEETIQCIQ